MIGFYLTDQTNKSKIQLPVNPKEFKLQYEADDKQETITNIGQVNILGKTKLTSIELSSVLPFDKPHYLATDNPIDPNSFIAKINSIRNNRHKVRLVITETNISLLMTIQSFQYGFEKAYMGDMPYTLKLMQYRDYGYTKLKSPKKKGKKKGKAAKKRTKPPKKVNVGSSVVVNGRLHADSYGRGAGMYEKNSKRKVLYIVPGRKYPVCVGINGIARGWVKRSEVRRA